MPSNPLRPNNLMIPATKSYLDAFAKLEAGDPGAIAAFAAHVGSNLMINLQASTSSAS